MVYSDVEKQGYFKSVEKKDSYDITDAEKLMNGDDNLTLSQATFIIKCIAIHNDAIIDCSIFEITKIRALIKKTVTEELPKDSLIKNIGIFESSNICYDKDKEGISIGVSYEEDEDGQELYIYNLFVGNTASYGGEYINISAQGSVEDYLPEDVLDELSEELLKFMNC